MSATGTWSKSSPFTANKAKATGFTLLEILVVMTLIAIFAAAAVTRIGSLNIDEHVQDSAHRFVALLQLASEEAVLTGTELGVQVTPTGYSFFRFKYDTREWIELEDDLTLRPRALPENIRFNLIIEGQDIVLATEQEGPAPQIQLLSSGEATPFQLFVSSDLQRGGYEIAGSLLGEFTLASDE
ncbi:MAG: type II secretion system minor pseudopilin GspH [Gammaproteobacteria bacterium]|nr:type II secretion system minor pseudopilin GspH [Gammaproteobacteria bacterium]